MWNCEIVEFTLWNLGNCGIVKLWNCEIYIVEFARLWNCGIVKLWNCGIWEIVELTLDIGNI